MDRTIDGDSHNRDNKILSHVNQLQTILDNLPAINFSGENSYADSTLAFVSTTTVLLWFSSPSELLSKYSQYSKDSNTLTSGGVIMYNVAKVMSSSVEDSMRAEHECQGHVPFVAVGEVKYMRNLIADMIRICKSVRDNDLSTESFLGSLRSHVTVDRSEIVIGVLSDTHKRSRLMDPQWMISNSMLNILRHRSPEHVSLDDGSDILILQSCLDTTRQITELPSILLFHSVSQTTSKILPPTFNLSFLVPQSWFGLSSACDIYELKDSSRASVFFESYVDTMYSLIGAISFQRTFHGGMSNYKYVHVHALNMKTKERLMPSNRVVISLTTLPERLPNIGYTLQSLLDQHILADAIFINVPLGYKRFHSTNTGNNSYAKLTKSYLMSLVPSSVKRLPVTFNYVKNDFGPATKLIPTLYLEQDPNTIIITVDDDMIFKPTLIRNLLYRHFNFPYYAYGYSGQMIDVDTSNGTQFRVRTAWQWKDADYPVDILEAFTGAVYRRSFFNVTALMETFSPGSNCFYTDDIWISAYLARSGISRIKLMQGWGDHAEFSVNDNINPLRQDNVNASGMQRNNLCVSDFAKDFIPTWIHHPANAFENSSTSMEVGDEACAFDFHSL
jgi:hypothetical protein